MGIAVFWDRIHAIAQPVEKLNGLLECGPEFHFFFGDGHEVFDVVFHGRMPLFEVEQRLVLSVEDPSVFGFESRVSTGRVEIIAVVFFGAPHQHAMVG